MITLDKLGSRLLVIAFVVVVLVSVAALVVFGMKDGR